MADHPNQVDKSVYAYAWNNPVYYDDSDGRCPHCPAAIIIGGLVGGGIELYQQWNSGGEINFSEVGISALKGGATAGLIAVGAPLVAAAGGLTTGTGILTSASIGTVASAHVEITSQLLTTGTVDGESVAITAIAGGLAAPIGGIVGKKLSESFTTSASTKAVDVFRTSTTGKAVTSPQTAAVNKLGAGANNGQKAAARKAARSDINTTAKSTYSATQKNIGRNSAIIQGGSAATATKTASQGNKSTYSQIKDWWNGN